MQQPIRSGESQTAFFHWVDARDILLALDDAALERMPLNRPLDYASLDRLGLAETLRYHRQLFLWRLYPRLGKWLRAATYPCNIQYTLQTTPLGTGN